MKRLIVFVSIYLLSAGVSLAQSAGPAELLARAVDESKLCNLTVEKLDTDSPVEKWKVLDQKESKVISKLSLSKLFKPGRFDLGDRVYKTQSQGRPALIIQFEPLPEKSQIKPSKLENEDYERAMNNLSGHVLIDEATGGFIEIKTELASEIPYSAIGMRVFNLESLSFSLNQRLVGESWLPDAAKLSVYGEKRFKLGEVDLKFRAKFDCTPTEVATK